MRGYIHSGLESSPRDTGPDGKPHDTGPGSNSRGAAGQPRPQWVERPERSNTLALRIFVWIALKAGRPAARLLLYPVCLYFLAFSSASHTASKKYLRKVLGREPGVADSFRHCHAFASTLLDRVFLFNNQYTRFDVRVHDEDILIKMTERGEGGFLLGAHMGSFEMVRALGRRNTAARISLIMYEENAKKFNAVLTAINPELSLQVILLGKIDSMLKVETALKRGEIVGMLGDRTFQGEGTAMFPFLGEEARFPTGPFRVAAMLNRPIVLMFGLYRGGDRYDIFLERLVDEWPARGERDRFLEAAQRRYVERVEHYCRDAPYNWYNFYDFWE